MVRRLILALIVVCAAALAARAAPGKPAVSVVAPEAAIDLPSGGEVVVPLALTVEPGFHIYAQGAGEDYIPLSFAAREPELKAGAAKITPEAKLEKLAGADKPIPVYEGKLEARVPLSGGAGWPIGARKVGVVVGYQACTNEYCQDPQKITVEVAVNVVAAKVGEVAPSVSATAGTGTGTGTSTSTSTKRSLLLEILGALLGGLFVTLTPCVYPVIPVTVTYFQQQGGTRAKAIPLALAYGAGIVTMYATLGVVMARLGRDLGSILGNTYVGWGFVALFVFLALSMFGWYELQLPSSWMTRLQGGERGGVFGALLLGLTLGLVAAPCVGPVAGGLMLIVAQTGDLLFGVLAFGAFGLGIALPFMVLGIFSGALGAIPRAGAWMEHVKYVFGYLLLGFAINFVFVATGSLALTFGLLAAWLLASGAAAQRSENVLVRALALALIAGGLYFGFGPYLIKPDGPIVAPQALFESKIRWQEDHDAALAQAKAAGKPVIVDFTARWCNACHELDFTAWRDEAVLAEARRFVPVKVDVTSDEKNQRIKTEVYKAFKIPFVAFYDSSGKQVTTLPRADADGITTADILNTLKEIH